MRKYFVNLKKPATEKAEALRFSLCCLPKNWDLSLEAIAAAKGRRAPQSGAKRLLLEEKLSALAD